MFHSRAVNGSILALVLVGSSLVAACGDESIPSFQHPVMMRTTSAIVRGEDTEAFGWETPITAENSSAAATKPLGMAAATLAGHSLRDVVTNPDVRVRGDNRPCVDCHSWAAQTTRAAFCARVPAFMAQPTSTGTNDPSNAKAHILKDLLSEWYATGCP